MLQLCSLDFFLVTPQGYREGCYEVLGDSSKKGSGAFRWALCIYTWRLSGKTILSEHISLGRACWWGWWSLGRDSSHAKEDTSIQLDGSHHDLHWLHQLRLHGELAHLEHMETLTPSAVLFCDALPHELDQVLQAMSIEMALGLPWVLCPVCQTCTGILGLLKQHQTHLHGQMNSESANFSLDA